MNVQDRLLDAFARDAGAGIPEMPPADEILSLLPHFDYPAQLTAIRDLLRRERAADAETTRAIRALESAPASQQAADERVDRLHGSVYQDAAHSMATVGMLAPLAESLFRYTLIAIGERYATLGLPVPPHPRFTKAQAWDPTNNGKRGIVAGIREICDGAGTLAVLALGGPALSRRTLRLQECDVPQWRGVAARRACELPVARVRVAGRLVRLERNWRRALDRLHDGRVHRWGPNDAGRRDGWFGRFARDLASRAVPGPP